ncbi:hypothetical protein RUND412_001068 [Rhizina undulata]
MITDQELNSLAIFLGSLMMGLIVLYHFLAVNSKGSKATSTNGVNGSHAAPSSAGRQLKRAQRTVGDWKEAWKGVGGARGRRHQD